MVGPGGVLWTPVSQLSSDVPQLPPPAIPSSTSQLGTTSTISSVPMSNTGSNAAQSTASDAFEISSLSETVRILDLDHP